MTQYPGLCLALRYFDPSDQLSTAGAIYPMGISAHCWGSQSKMLLVREAAMMIVMDQLSEKPHWYEKVHDNAIADKWIEEGLTIPVQPLYDTITRGKIRERSGSEITYPRRLPTLLNRQCMEYVSGSPFSDLPNANDIRSVSRSSELKLSITRKPD